MDAALLLTGLLMGVAGTPHCAAMCAAPCAAALGGRRDVASLGVWQFGRMAGYATAGALVAAGAGMLSEMGRATEALRPFWALLHVAAFALGAWLLVAGRQPAWLRRLGARPTEATGGVGVIASPGSACTLTRTSAALSRAALAGGAWALWPCGLLQSALVVAALANGPAGGAATMAAFAIGSFAGPMIGPGLWAKLGGKSITPAWAVRTAGGLLAASSGWAIGAGVWHRIAAWCA